MSFETRLFTYCYIPYFVNFVFNLSPTFLDIISGPPDLLTFHIRNIVYCSVVINFGSNSHSPLHPAPLFAIFLISFDFMYLLLLWTPDYISPCVYFTLQTFAVGLRTLTVYKQLVFVVRPQFESRPSSPQSYSN